MDRNRTGIVAKDQAETISFPGPAPKWFFIFHRFKKMARARGRRSAHPSLKGSFPGAP